MQNESKVEVKFKLDKHRFIRLEVEKEKLPLVRENNREISRNEKREVRHESMYSLETLSEKEGNELSAGTANAEEEIIERETIAERNERLYAAIRTLSSRQQEIIRKRSCTKSTAGSWRKKGIKSRFWTCANRTARQSGIP